MNELELKQCLETHPLTKSYFRGVYARDELPKKGLVPNSLVVVNTDKRQSPGEHWVLCFWKEKDDLPLYFDSYGVAVFHKEIEAFITRNSKQFYFNGEQLQSETSSVCGHYVTYFASQLCSGYDLVNIRKRFSSCHSLNDKLILTLFRKEFGLQCVRYKATYTPMSCHCLCEYGDDK